MHAHEADCLLHGHWYLRLAAYATVVACVPKIVYILLCQRSLLPQQFGLPTILCFSALLAALQQQTLLSSVLAEGRCKATGRGASAGRNYTLPVMSPSHDHMICFAACLQCDAAFCADGGPRQVALSINLPVCFNKILPGSSCCRCFFSSRMPCCLLGSRLFFAGGGNAQLRLLLPGSAWFSYEDIGEAD